MLIGEVAVEAGDGLIWAFIAAGVVASFMALTYGALAGIYPVSARADVYTEREFREVRRRTKVNDHSFNDMDSARRYHEGIFQHLNEHYPAR